MTTDRPTYVFGRAFLEEIQMAISHQRIIRSTSGLVLRWSCRSRPIQQCHLYLRLTDPHCKGNKILNEMGYNSVSVRDICKRVFKDGLSMAANQIFPQSTPVAMATKFGTKWAITRFL